MLHLKINPNYSLRFSSYRTINIFLSVIKRNQLMLYTEIVAVCSVMHKNHRYVLFGQSLEVLTVREVTNVLMV